ncbi:hypothetical protein O181_100989 [Austropuccinia psidii MF-1]|uniref:Uncharacterized protein n=1 Tax=Austropuccinia psidii MF-1 TaxID=1389203 RepID=A0A9Q3PGX3_9BASI|nr:hypothetical protein [Austropuccinia psidii MF-1]
MLTLPLHSQGIPLTLPPHFRPHPSLCFCTPTAYHAYTPAAPSRYISDTRTSSLCSPILTLTLRQDPQDMPPTLLPHVCPHPSLRFCTPPYLLCHLPSLHYNTRLIGYSGLLEYNTITEIC